MYHKIIFKFSLFSILIFYSTCQDDGPKLRYEQIKEISDNVASRDLNVGRPINVDTMLIDGNVDDTLETLTDDQISLALSQLSDEDLKNLNELIASEKSETDHGEHLTSTRYQRSNNDKLGEDYYSFENIFEDAQNRPNSIGKIDYVVSDYMPMNEDSDKYVYYDEVDMPKDSNTKFSKKSSADTRYMKKRSVNFGKDGETDNHPNDEEYIKLLEDSFSNSIPSENNNNGYLVRVKRRA